MKHQPATALVGPSGQLWVRQAFSKRPVPFGNQIVRFALQNYFDHHAIGERPQRRRLERAPVNMPVSYSVVGDGRSRNVSALNLSGSGVRISSVERLGPGTQIEVQSRLPNTERVILARGQVLRSLFDDTTKEYSHGVAFTVYIAQSDQEAIVTFVQETLPAAPITSNCIVILELLRFHALLSSETRRACRPSAIQSSQSTVKRLSPS